MSLFCAWRLKAKFLILIVVVKLECLDRDADREDKQQPRSSGVYCALNESARCIDWTLTADRLMFIGRLSGAYDTFRTRELQLHFLILKIFESFLRQV